MKTIELTQNAFVPPEPYGTFDFYQTRAIRMVGVINPCLIRTYAKVAFFVISLLTSATAYATCNFEKDVSAVDLSRPVDEHFLNEIGARGIKTIMRYYDWRRESMCDKPSGFCGKTLMPPELALISSHDLEIVVVFQHKSSSIGTYYPPKGRGKTDAERSLELAKINAQPKGSAIYFGTDGVDQRFKDSHTFKHDKYGLTYIKNYFSEVNKVMKESGYDIGVYGSGLVCNELIKDGLAKYCWLAAPSGWPDSKNYQEWHIKQLTPIDRTCAGKRIDVNVIKQPNSSFGQWRIKH